MTIEGASGRAPGITEADWQELASRGPAGRRSAGSESPDGKAAARVRGWLRRTPQAAADVAPIAPSVVAAGPELDLAANDPLIGYLLGAASAVDITGLQLLSPTLTALGERLGIANPVVDTKTTCVDAKRQWRHANNIWHNSMIRSVLQTLTFRRNKRAT